MRQEAGSDLSPSLTAALSTVDRHGPLTPSELAKRERIQRPTATRVLARLEEEGLIQRTADLYDRRSSLVAVTAKGSELLDELRERMDHQLSMPPPQIKACRGRMFSRADYAVDVQQWGFADVAGDGDLRSD